MSSLLGITLPTSWSAAPLKHLTAVLNRGSAPDYVDVGHVRAISQASNQASGLDWSRTRFHSFSGNPENLKGYLRPNDVLINSTGTGTLGRVGYFAAPPDGLPCMADSHVTIARAKADELGARFSYYWLSSRPFQEYVYAALVVGATNQIELNRDRLGDAPVPLPPLEEQRRIADFLDAETARIDTLMQAYARLRDLASERSQRVIDSEFEQQQNHTYLRYLVRFREGPGIMAVDFRGEGTPLIRIAGLHRGEVTLRGCNFLDPEKVSRQWAQFRLKRGDRLISGSATMGEISVVMDPSVIGSIPYTGLIILRPARQDVDMEYVEAFLRSSLFTRQIEVLKTGATMQHFGPTHLSQVRAPMPSYEEQLRIAKHVQETLAYASRCEDLVGRQLSLLTERRQALITAAVTGQFDVSTASGRNVMDGVNA